MMLINKSQETIEVSENSKLASWGLCVTWVWKVCMFKHHILNILIEKNSTYISSNLGLMVDHRAINFYNWVGFCLVISDINNIQSHGDKMQVTVKILCCLCKLFNWGRHDCIREVFPGWGHHFVFLGKMLHSHSVSLHPVLWMGTSKFSAGENPLLNCSIACRPWWRRINWDNWKYWNAISSYKF